LAGLHVGTCASTVYTLAWWHAWRSGNTLVSILDQRSCSSLHRSLW